MKEPNEAIRIVEITDAEQLKTVEQLAWKIFPETYKAILSAEQIPYMMEMMYSQTVLNREFSGNMHFALICDGETPVGYVSWHPEDLGGVPGIKLEKLYLDFAYHGRSIGNLALRYVIRTAEQTKAAAVVLNVNKENLRAQKAYQRAGFFRWRSEKNPIGGGYYMDDYVMRCDLPR